MKVKLPSGKVIAYTVGRSVLVIKGADVNIIGKDYSVRINDPENPQDSITVAMENGEVQVETLPEEEQHGEEENEKNDGEKAGDDELSGEPSGHDDSGGKQPDGESDESSDGDSEESPEEVAGDDGAGDEPQVSRRFTRIRK